MKVKIARMKTRRKISFGITIMTVVSIALLISFVAQADMTIHFTLLNSQQSDPDAAWWAGKSNMLFDHNNSGFPGADDMVWDWWGYNKDFTGAGHYYFSEINFDCHEKTGGGSSGTPDCSVEDYYFKGLPCGYIDRLRESDDARDSTFDLSLSGSGPDYTVDYGDTVEVYGWALVKAIMRHTSDFSFAEPGQGAQASGGTYDSATNVLDAWVNINLDFINPIPSDPNGMSPVDTQEAWMDAFEQKGYIIPKAEFTAWHDGTPPEAGKYMVPTYTLGNASPYPDEYIETGLEDMGPWLDNLVDDNLGAVWSEIENADYLYIAFSQDNFVIDDGDYTSVDSDGIPGNEGKTSADGANLMTLHPEAWPILAKTFLNDEIVWIAKGKKIVIARPNFTPDLGIYPTGVLVEMSCITEGATICYTTNGTDPDDNSTEYTEPILITKTTTLKARAYNEGSEPSPVTEGKYTIQGQVSTPEFVPKPDYYWLDEDVELKCQIEDARIYYTTDETDPDPDKSSTKYTKPILITKTTTLKARAYKEEFEPSEIAEGKFIILKKLRKPEFLPDAQVFDPPFITVIIKYFSIGGIKYPNLDAVFRYTTDGTDPDVNSTKYTDSNPITLSETTTLKARAYKDGFEPSDVAIKIYVKEGGCLVAGFMATPTSGSVPLTVDFSDQTTGGVKPYTYEWDFDNDGSVDNDDEQNPSHEYSDPGTYTVSLKVTDFEENEDTQTKTDYITVTEPGAAPVADFSGSPTTGTVLLTVNFTDSSTGDIDSYVWSFGDGGTSTEQNPTHIYQNIGTYTVSLTVSGTGGSDNETKTDYITVTGSGEAPDVDFSASPKSGSVPLTVQFTDFSTGEINSWSWSFGDNGTSEEQNPTHVYERPGAWRIKYQNQNRLYHSTF